jgi:hypothetical protein
MGLVQRRIAASESGTLRARRRQERTIANPHHIETCIRYAAMRQIHAAMTHLQRGDFECAMTLAAAGEAMLPPTDEPHYRLLAGMTEVGPLVDWLRHGPMADKKASGGRCGQSVTIEESDVIFVIYRAITKFDAVFGDQKTPQMVSFRICATRRLAAAFDHSVPY